MGVLAVRYIWSLTRIITTLASSGTIGALKQYSHSLEVQGKITQTTLESGCQKIASWF